MDVEPGDYLLDSAPARDPDTPGRYTGDIPEAWKVFFVFGGISMGIALRAIEAELDRPDLRPVTASSLFCAPQPCGPVTIDTTVLRNGRSAAQGAADLRVPGEPTVAQRMHATFGLDHDGPFTFEHARMPDVPPPDDCEPPPPERPPDDPFPKINYHDQTEWRPAMPQRAWDREVQDATAGPAEFASWIRLMKEPRHPDGSYDWSALCVPADMIAPAIGRATHHVPVEQQFFVLSLEIAMHFFARPAGEWILQHCEGWRSADGYASGSTLLWDEAGQLLAAAMQVAHVRPMPTTPTP